MFKMTKEQKGKIDSKVGSFSKWVSALITPSLLTVLIAFVYNFGGQRIKDEQKMFSSPAEKYRTIEAVKEFTKSGMTSIDGYKLDERIDSIYTRGKEWHSWRNNVDSTFKGNSDMIKRNAVTSYQNGKKLDSVLKMLQILSSNSGASIHTKPKVRYYTSDVRSKSYVEMTGAATNQDFLTPEMEEIFNEYNKK